MSIIPYRAPPRVGARTHAAQGRAPGRRVRTGLLVSLGWLGKSLARTFVRSTLMFNLRGDARWTYEDAYAHARVGQHALSPRRSAAGRTLTHLLRGQSALYSRRSTLSFYAPCTARGVRQEDFDVRNLTRVATGPYARCRGADAGGKGDGVWVGYRLSAYASRCFGTCDGCARRFHRKGIWNLDAPGASSRQDLRNDALSLAHISPATHGNNHDLVFIIYMQHKIRSLRIAGAHSAHRVCRGRTALCHACQWVSLGS